MQTTGTPNSFHQPVITVGAVKVALGQVEPQMGQQVVTSHIGVGTSVATIQLLRLSIEGVVVIVLIQLQMVMNNAYGDGLR